MRFDLFCACSRAFLNLRKPLVGDQTSNKSPCREGRSSRLSSAQYLIQQGHKRIVFFGGEQEIESRMQRISGYLTAMLAAGLETLVWPCRDSKRGGAEALPKLLEKHPETSAIVCIGDMVALGASLALNHLGKQAGHDLAVVGFDNIPEAALWMPGLTTMAVNPFGLGEQLARTLLERIESPESSIRYVHLPAKLTLRETA